MVNFKVLLAGKVNAGKTTFIRQISDFDPITVDEMPTTAEELAMKGGKATTVGLDYGSIQIDDITLHLFGTPGQERFDFIWEVLSQGSLGVIILVDSTNPSSIDDAPKLIEYYTNLKLPCVIGVTKQELPSALPLEMILGRLAAVTDKIIIPFNTYDKEEVKLLLLTLLNLVMETSEEIVMMQ